MERMKPKVSVLIALLLTTAVSYPACAEVARKKYVPFLTRGDTSISLGAGIRNNNFDFNIASDITGNSTPNVASELQWEDIRIFEGTANIRHIQPVEIPYLRGAVHIEGTAKAGMVTSGDVQDSDFLGDDRTQEFSRSNNAADDGYSLGLSAAIGYRFDVTPESMRRSSGQSYLSLTPLAGYGWDRQVYTMMDGYQTIPHQGAFAGLDSEYQADWFGPFLGLEAEWQKSRHLLRVRGEYHDLEFEGEGIWNLRPDFRQDPSFAQEGDGDGYRLDAEYAYAINPNYVLTVNGAYQQRNVEDGITHFYLSNNAQAAPQKLNEANDKSSEVRLGVRYHW